MVRMEKSTHDRLKAIAKANGLTVSDIMRLSVTRQLPALSSGLTKLHPA